MRVSKGYMSMAGLIIAAGSLMLSSAAMAIDKSKTAAPAAKQVVSQSNIKFEELSVAFMKTDVVIPKTPGSIRLICHFSDQGLVKTSHSVGLYINNKQVFYDAKAGGSGDPKLAGHYYSVHDLDMPAVGNYTFKCVVDESSSKSKSLPFQIVSLFNVTCRPIVAVPMVPSKSKLMNDLVPDNVSTVIDATIGNVSCAQNPAFSLTGSAIIANGNEVTCSYGQAVTYRAACKNAKKVSQHKYQCKP
jgi:hypothetical protein